MSELKPVTFAKVWRGYNVDETAGFSAEVADMLVSNGIAVEYDPAATGAKPKRVRAAAPKPSAESGPAAATTSGGALASGGDSTDTGPAEAKP